jgi:hypothetical protein
MKSFSKVNLQFHAEIAATLSTACLGHLGIMCVTSPKEAKIGMVTITEDISVKELSLLKSN